MICNQKLVGDKFHCSDDRHEHEDGEFLVMEINLKKNSALIKGPFAQKGHWVKARNLYKSVK